MAQARSFPWTSLQRARHVDGRMLAAARSALLPPSAVAACLGEMGSILSCPVKAIAISVGCDFPTPVVASTLVLNLRVPNGPVPWSLVLEIEAPLVVAVVARVARRPSPRVAHSNNAGVSTSTAGAFAAALACAIRRAIGPVVVTGAGTSALTSVSPEHLVVNFTVHVDAEVGLVRAVVPRVILSSLTDAFSVDDAIVLGSTPLRIPVVACRTQATVAEIAALAVGDVWLLGKGWTLDSALARAVWLCPPDTEVGFSASLEPDGRLVLGSGVEALGWSPMNDPNDTPTLVEAVGEVPVVVRVEVGCARMKAREWAKLAPGDVIGLGSRIGSLVTLRVSGLAVAEGDLVDIDGEVGVRIRRRLGEK